MSSRLLFHVADLNATSKCGSATVLSNVNVTFTNDDLGKLFILHGPIGSGKSTLLRMIRRLHCQSELRRDVLNVHHGKLYSEFSVDRVGYLPSSNQLLSSLTAFEYLYFRSRMARRLLSCEQEDTIDFHRQKVYSIMSELGIQSLASQRIGHGLDNQGGMSGGERRRIAVAAELLFDPAILVLDEPTTGLDTMNTFQLICLLKTIAKQRQLIVVISCHHISDAILDTAVVDGLLLMNGSKYTAKQYDHKAILLSDATDVVLPMTVPSPNSYPMDKFTLLVTFSRRHLLMRWRMVNTRVVWTCRLCVAVLASMCFWNSLNLTDGANFFDHKGILFVLLMYMQYETLYISQGNGTEERECYSYELMRHSISPSILTTGKILGELAMNCLNIFPLLVFTMMSGVAYTDVASTDIGIKFLIYLLFVLVISSMWRSVGMWITDMRRMTWIGDLYINVTMQVAGFWVALSAISRHGLWVRYLSIISQTFNALVQSSLQSEVYRSIGWDGVATIQTGKELMDQEGIDLPIWLNVVLLVVLFVVFETISYLGAKFGRPHRYN